jgi:hypothetical protein
MVKVIVAEKKIDCSHLLGKFVDESHYDILVEEDADVYMPATCDIATQATCELNKDCASCSKGTDELRIAFKFRKNYFTKEEQDAAYLGLREAAGRTENRGLASGIKDGVLATSEGREWVTNYQDEMMQMILKNRTESLIDEDVIDIIRAKYPREVDKKMAGGDGKNNVWVISRFRGKFDFEQWLDSIKPLTREERAKATEEVMKMVSTTTYGNAVNSGIAGWFDRYPRIPYGRATSYTRDNFDKFKMAYPFLQTLAKGFKDLLPWRYNNQMEAAKKVDPRYLVPETPFTTITVNKTFRTAAHFDAGDLHTGLSNLLVLSNNGNYKGGYLVAPEYRVAVNVRPGDLLLINNHEVLHGNTPIELLDEEAERVSLVCYFREKMLELGSYEYEECRYNFVEKRRLNKEHPLWKHLWNGVSEGMWETKEWYDYLEEQLGRDVLVKYHPKANAGSLEGFF